MLSCRSWKRKTKTSSELPPVHRLLFQTRRKEFQHRRIERKSASLTVVGWLIAQIARQIFPFLETPIWVVRLVIVLIAIGFSIALVVGQACTDSLARST